MQKFADLFSLGTVLKIKSAFAVDHMKGCVYIEAERQYDINEVTLVLGIFVRFNLIGFKLRCQLANVAEILVAYKNLDHVIEIVVYDRFLAPC